MIVHPSTARITHRTRAATAKSAPFVASAVPATEPHSATPRLTPTWRLVDAIADAAPARSVGIPLTAAVVIGAFTIEKPIPNTAKMTSSCHTGVVAVSTVSSTVDAVIRTPATTIDGRPPYRPTIRPDSGEKTSAPRATGR